MVFKLVLSTYFFLAVSLPFGELHTFYISTCYVKQEGNRVVVDYRIFIDDLAQALQKNQVPDEASAYCEEVASYIKEHFSLIFDGREIDLTLIGCDIAGEAQLRTVSCKLAGDLEDPENVVISIMSSVLIDEFEDQVNMIHARINGVKKSVNLDKGRTTFTMSRPQ